MTTDKEIIDNKTIQLLELLDKYQQLTTLNRENFINGFFNLSRANFQNEKENVSLIRLSASFVAMKCGFSLDDIEDIKLCASECLNLQRNRSEIIDCTMIIDDESLSLIFKLDGKNPRENNEKDKISEMIIQSLMDEYEINGSEIKVIKNRK